MDNWVLVPCHNNAPLLMAGLESILAQTIPVRILAINNGSKDNVPFVLNNLDNQHVVINFYPQLGVAGAWNAGLRYLFQREKAERVLVVNQDVSLLPETYEILDGRSEEFITAVSVGGLNDLKWDPNATKNTRRLHPDFSCFRIKRSCFERVGAFDEGFYPAWFEDNDYHIRAARAGVELYCTDIPFYHYAAGTMKTASEYDKAHYYGPGFLKSKQRFQDKWGCLPGTKEYEEKCDPSYWNATTASSSGS